MLSIVRRNFGLKVFAFVLALAAWAYFRFSGNPSIAARFDQQLSIPIVVTGLRPGFVARYTDKFAVVTIDAPRSGAAIKPEQVQAVLDLSNHPDPGVYNVAIQIIAPSLQIRSLSPASVTLGLDRFEQRSVPVAIAYAGDRPGIVVQSADVSPAAIVLRGVSTDLARVQGVRVDIGVPSRPSIVDEMVRPVAVDARGSDVDAVQLSPNLVRVHVRFIPSTGTESK